MVRGTIVSLAPLRLLPTFSYACDVNPTFLRLYTRRLGDLGYSLPGENGHGSYALYSGDSSVPGKGEILVWRA
jgi:hypothetical protein